MNRFSRVISNNSFEKKVMNSCLKCAFRICKSNLFGLERILSLVQNTVINFKYIHILTNENALILLN